MERTQQRTSLRTCPLLWERNAPRRGAPRQSKSEPAFRSAWGERERGWESPFAFERSGSNRAEGAAPEKGKSCSDFPFSGAGGGTRTHTVLLPADFESATSTIPSHRRTDSEYITESGKFQEKFIEFSPAVLEKGSQGQWG